MPESPTLWSHLSVWLVLGGAFACALPLGHLLAAARYCTLGAVSDWWTLRDTHRLRMWAAAAGTAMLGTEALRLWAGLDPARTLVPYASPHFAWIRYVAGGFVFGIGMHLAGGCASRQLLRLGGGSLKAGLALLVAAFTAAWLIDAGAYRSWLAPLMNLGAIDLDGLGLADQRLTSFARLAWPGETTATLVAGTLGGGLLFAAHGRADSRLTTVEWRAGLALGIAVVAGWWLSGGSPGRAWQEDMAFLDAMPRGVGAQSYTFVAPLADLVACVRGRAPSFGLCGAAGLVAGSLLWHWRHGRLRVERHRNVRDLLRTVLGGALLAVGGVTALGCTVGQGVTGLSTLALGSMLATLATIAGAACAIRVEYALGSAA